METHIAFVVSFTIADYRNENSKTPCRGLSEHIVVIIDPRSFLQAETDHAERRAKVFIYKLVNLYIADLTKSWKER